MSVSNDVKQEIDRILQTPKIAANMSEKTYDLLKSHSKDIDSYNGLPIVINNSIPFGSVWIQHEGDL